MPVLGIIASQISGHLFAPSGAYESIATTTLTTTTASVTFSSIPATYTHLQVRCLMRTDRAVSYTATNWRFNSDTSSNYSYHALTGDGATATADAGASTTRYIDYINGASSTASAFSVTVLDILDYTNTNKYKTTRILNGYDANGSGVINLFSGNWRNTNAITSITLTATSGDLVQYSSFALYGIK
jgi:hypothetical protein